MSEIPTWAELRERHIRKAGGAEDMSTFENMSEEAQKNPQEPPRTKWVHLVTGYSGEPYRDSADFDADKMQPISNTAPSPKSNAPYYENGAWNVYPIGGFYVSKMTEQGGAQFADVRRKLKHEEERKYPKASVIELDPKTHRVVDSLKDWADLVRQYPEEIRERPQGNISYDRYSDMQRARGVKDYLDPRKRKIYSANYKNLINNGIRSLEFTPNFMKEYSGIDYSDPRGRAPYGYDMDPRRQLEVGDAFYAVPGQFWTEPQALVLDPGAILSSTPYDLEHMERKRKETYLTAEEAMEISRRKQTLRKLAETLHKLT